MQKLIIVILGLVAIFAYASAVDCPTDEGSTPQYYPHETECGKFYECDNGKAQLFECAPGSYWDSRLVICSTEADCGDLLTSTVTPSPTDSD